MLPSLSRVMPHGLLNSPSPLPLLPHGGENLQAVVAAVDDNHVATGVADDPGWILQFSRTAARRSPLANEFACGIEDRDGVRPLVCHVHVVVLVHRDAERPDGMSVCFAVRAELGKQFFLARAADLHAID